MHRVKVHLFEGTGSSSIPERHGRLRSCNELPRTVVRHDTKLKILKNVHLFPLLGLLHFLVYYSPHHLL